MALACKGVMQSDLNYVLTVILKHAPPNRPMLGFCFSITVLVYCWEVLGRKGEEVSTLKGCFSFMIKEVCYIYLRVFEQGPRATSTMLSIHWEQNSNIKL